MGRPELWHSLVVLPDQRIFVPKEDAIRTLLISSAHDPIVCGHFGLEKTLEKLARHWWWHGIGAEVQEYVKTCARCQRMKHETAKTRGLLRPILASCPWHTVTMDFVGKFEPGHLLGNTYCLVIIDKFSKYTILHSVPETCDSQALVDIFL